MEAAQPPVGRCPTRFTLTGAGAGSSELPESSESVWSESDLVGIRKNGIRPKGRSDSDHREPLTWLIKLINRSDFMLCTHRPKRRFGPRPVSREPEPRGLVCWRIGQIAPSAHAMILSSARTTLWHYLACQCATPNSLPALLSETSWCRTQLETSAGRLVHHSRPH